MEARIERRQEDCRTRIIEASTAAKHLCDLLQAVEKHLLIFILPFLLRVHFYKQSLYFYRFRLAIAMPDRWIAERSVEEKLDFANENLASF
jgi:hypothetical protein